jgi:hypothetical protein
VVSLGTVRSTRTEAIGDDSGEVVSTIELDPRGWTVGVMRRYW